MLLINVHKCFLKNVADDNRLKKKLYVYQVILNIYNPFSD